MNNDLKQIKKIYGEEMMHMCRELFPTLLEQDGLLLKILTDHLAPTHSFAEDIRNNHLETEFKNWIYSYTKDDIDKLIDTGKSPFELMKEAGYTLYECKNEYDIQKFKKYYKKGEELCTFHGGRLNRCHVFFAVKNNVDEIKREDFPIPKREDEYGTSVISIQFERGEINTLSIKNRYNHIVNNPDCTFGNNLETIIRGLTKAFEKQYKLNIKQQSSPQEYFLTNTLHYVNAIDGKFYRYNAETANNYCCENNIVVNFLGDVINTYANNKERYLVFDTYILDLKEKKFDFVGSRFGEAFLSSISDTGVIQKIDVVKGDDTKNIIIYFNRDRKARIEINKYNQIIGYENNYVSYIYDFFLWHSVNVKWVSLPKAVIIGQSFMYNNKKALEYLNLPEAREIRAGFLEYNNKLTSISLPKAEIIESNFLRDNTNIESVYLPNVEYIGDFFMYNSKKLRHVELPKLKSIGTHGFKNSFNMRQVDLPEVENIGNDFLWFNTRLKKINMPKLKSVGYNCFGYTMLGSLLRLKCYGQSLIDKSFTVHRREKS